jgi:shikimate dehydrogenase
MDEPAKLFGLIGFPLGHSWSKGYFSQKFDIEGLTDCSYENFEIADINLLPGIIAANPSLRGLNVTIPYKQSVLPLLNHVDAVAGQIGAVNTIKIDRHSGEIQLSGFNTDITGFTGSLAKQACKATTALVFGTGGSSLAIRFALAQMGISCISLSRNGSSGSLAYSSLSDELAAASMLWINCTPVGMYPHVDEVLPLPWHCLTPNHLLYDLVYNPAETVFLRRGREAGAATVNGLAMLHGQAEASWAIWNRNTI